LCSRGIPAGRKRLQQKGESDNEHRSGHKVLRIRFSEGRMRSREMQAPILASACIGPSLKVGKRSNRRTVRAALLCARAHFLLVSLCYHKDDCNSCRRAALPA
jgi:hypothetical protein